VLPAGRDCSVETARHRMCSNELALVAAHDDADTRESITPALANRIQIAIVRTAKSSRAAPGFVRPRFIGWSRRHRAGESHRRNAHNTPTKRSQHSRAVEALAGRRDRASAREMTSPAPMRSRPARTSTASDTTMGRPEPRPRRIGREMQLLQCRPPQDPSSGKLLEQPGSSGSLPAGGPLRSGDPSTRSDRVVSARTSLALSAREGSVVARVDRRAAVLRAAAARVVGGP
jgi:hypothetical protein